MKINLKNSFCGYRLMIIVIIIFGWIGEASAQDERYEFYNQYFQHELCNWFNDTKQFDQCSILPKYSFFLKPKLANRKITIDFEKGKMLGWPILIESISFNQKGLIEKWTFYPQGPSIGSKIDTFSFYYSYSCFDTLVNVKLYKNLILEEENTYIYNSKLLIDSCVQTKKGLVISFKCKYDSADRIATTLQYKDDKMKVIEDFQYGFKHEYDRLFVFSNYFDDIKKYGQMNTLYSLISKVFGKISSIRGVNYIYKVNNINKEKSFKYEDDSILIVCNEPFSRNSTLYYYRDKSDGSHLLYNNWVAPQRVSNNNSSSRGIFKLNYTNGANSFFSFFREGKAIRYFSCEHILAGNYNIVEFEPSSFAVTARLTINVY